MSQRLVCDQCDKKIDPPDTREIKLKYLYSTPDGDETDESDFCSWKCLKAAIKRIMYEDYQT